MVLGRWLLEVRGRQRQVGLPFIGLQPERRVGGNSRLRAKSGGYRELARDRVDRGRAPGALTQVRTRSWGEGILGREDRIARSAMKECESGKLRQRIRGAQGVVASRYFRTVAYHGASRLGYVWQVRAAT